MRTIALGKTRISAIQFPPLKRICEFYVFLRVVARKQEPVVEQQETIHMRSLRSLMYTARNAQVEYHYQFTSVRIVCSGLVITCLLHVVKA